MIETFIKPMIYNKNRTITKQIAGGTKLGLLSAKAFIETAETVDV